MTKVTLLFPNLRALWAFAQEIHVKTMEIQTVNNTLICECKGHDIELAQEKYRAIVKELASF